MLECLQRALRVADACMDTAVSVELFVEILNRYVYYFEQENEAVRSRNIPIIMMIGHNCSHEISDPKQVTTKYLNGLIELIHSNLNTTENASALEQPRRHFQRTLEYIASKQWDGVETKPK